MNLNNPLFRLNPLFLFFSSLYCTYESVLWVQQTISIQFKMINLTSPVTVSSLFNKPQNLILPFLLTSPCVYEETKKKKVQFSKFCTIYFGQFHRNDHTLYNFTLQSLDMFFVTAKQSRY
jgi:hypothetical protein